MLAADFYVLAARDRGGTPVTFEDVRRQFREPTTTAPVQPSSTSAPSTTPGASTALAPESSATRVAAPPPTTSGPRPPTATTEHAYRLPAEGIYTYATTGGETVSFGSARHDYPSETFATVRWTGPCEWQFEQRIVREHAERRTFCTDAAGVTQLAHSITVSFFGQTETEDIRCDPPQVLLRPGDPPGTVRHAVCRSGGSENRSHLTYVGRTTMPIGGIPVAVEHVVVDTVVSGRATGNSHTEQWLVAETGLIVKEHQERQTTTRWFGQSVEYHHRATFELQSITPQH